MYMVLAYLPLRMVLHMQLLNHKFRNDFVPLAFKMMSSRGTMENGRTKQRVMMFASNTSQDPAVLRPPIHPVKLMDFNK